MHQHTQQHRRGHRRIAGLAIAIASIATTLVAVQQPPAAEAAIDRMAGADRFATAVQVSRALPTNSGGVVFLASGLSFPDALAAAPVAAAESGRLLLSQPNDIPDVIAAEIRRVAPREIVIVGGESTLNDAVRAEAASLAGTVTRIAGGNRIETSMLLLDRMRLTTQPTHVWIVSASSFPDALAAGAVAARLRHGIVLTNGADPAFAQMLRERLGGVNRIDIAGGPSSVGTDVEQLAASLVSTVRYAGANRFATSVVINSAFTGWATNNRMLLASGETFPDGLVASVLAGRQGYPLYLVPRACHFDGGVQSEASRLGIRDTTVIGGTGSVTNISAQLERCPDLNAIQWELVSLVNQQRAAAGVGALTAHGGLMSMAGSWSQQMASQQQMVHSTTFCDQTFQMGFRRCAENIARTGSPSASGVMNAWMNSEGHRNNILNPNLTYIGVGLAQGTDGRWYWTQNFGG